MNKKITLIEKATRIMLEAHAGQKRKTDDSPYVVHPIMTAIKLAKHKFPDEVIAAGLLHDVLEDTKYPAAKIKKELGDKVLKIVQTVSEDKSLPSWEERKLKYIARVKAGNSAAKAVSIADKIHNLESILAGHRTMGAKIWNKFTRGKNKKIWLESQMLKMFKSNWKHPMINEYTKLIKQVKKLS